MGLPRDLEVLFWDVDFSSVDLDTHRSFIIRRVLDCGDLDAITWLRRTVGDAGIRDWFLAKDGGGLEPRKLRFWGNLLDLPVDRVDDWVREARQSIWHSRAYR